MENIFDMITIGELARLADVSVKSLRYYEKIGILIPAFINPENDYRYYSFAQINIVFAIKFYVRLDIPLSELNNYIDPTTHQINFHDQISFGIETAYQKIAETKKLISEAKFLTKEMARSTAIIEKNHPINEQVPEKHCLCIEFSETPNEQNYYSLLRKLLLDTKKAGIQTGNETGILFQKNNNLQNVFIFADIIPQNRKIKKDPRYLYIPKQNFYATEATFSDLFTKKYQEKYFSKALPDIVIFSELMTNHYDFYHPHFELRWTTHEASAKN